MTGAIPALMVLLIAGTGIQVDPPIAVTWDAPEGCPPLDELRAEIQRLAGPAAAPAELPTAQATVRRMAGSRARPNDSWQLILITRTGAQEGERRLVASDCVSLMRATALVLALMINPSAGAPPPPTSLLPPELPAPLPVLVVAPPPEPAAPSPTFAIGVDLLVGVGLLPDGATAGVGLRVAWLQRMLSIEGRGAIWSGRRAANSSDASAGGSFDRTDVALAGCATARRARRISPGLCAGVSLARGHGSGFGISDPSEATAWWAGGLIEGNVRFRPTPRNAVRVGVEAFAPFGRPTFALTGIGPVWTPAAFGARATLGWELNF